MNHSARACVRASQQQPKAARSVSQSHAPNIQHPVPTRQVVSNLPGMPTDTDEAIPKAGQGPGAISNVRSFVRREADHVTIRT